MSRRIRLGMVGGGEGSFIGAAHRVAARLDDGYELVAAALSSNPARAQSSGAILHLAPERCYADYREMAKAERARSDGIDVVAIVTPNHLHVPVARCFLEQGIHVICDKPLGLSVAEVEDLRQQVQRSGLMFMVTHTYSGYPMVRHARELVQQGAVGDVRVVQVEYAQDWLAEPLELTGHKQASWRSNPALAGPAGALGDIGTHAFHLAEYVTGLRTEALCAGLNTFVPGRTLDDDVQVMLRFQGGARGMLWASQVAVGNSNRLQLRVYGNKGGLHFDHAKQDQLVFSKLGAAEQTIYRGSVAADSSAAAATRLPPGHPEGYFEAFAHLYREFAASWRQHQSGYPQMTNYPNIADGCRGMAFIESTLKSSVAGSLWVDL
jgi:predicted dehydrogenase